MSSCANKVIQHVPRGYSYLEVATPCGSTGIYGDKLLCEDCEADAKDAYPQGWVGAPGDVCKHGTYLGCHEDNDERLCGQCESENEGDRA